MLPDIDYAVVVNMKGTRHTCLAMLCSIFASHTLCLQAPVLQRRSMGLEGEQNDSARPPLGTSTGKIPLLSSYLILHAFIVETYGPGHTY